MLARRKPSSFLTIARSAPRLGHFRCPAFLFELFEQSSSPYINHFLSADSIVPNAFNPQSLNRFSYVHNHPLRYTDPTGHMLDDGCRDYGCNTVPPSTPPTAPKPKPNPLPDPTPLPSSIPTPTPTPIPIPIPIPTTPLLGPTLTLPLLPAPTIISTGTAPTSLVQAGSIFTSTINTPISGPEWCNWLDCVLSAVSFFASAFTFAPPPIDAIAFGVDVVATVWAVLRTNEDYAQGEISRTRQLSLNIRGIIGVVPFEVGTGASFVNLLMTVTGLPE